jgi:hypothetical protein
MIAGAYSTTTLSAQLKQQDDKRQKQESKDSRSKINEQCGKV